MDESSAFIRMISDNPDDDVPRLVYADWLEESGEGLKMARAEFIRLEIRLHRLPPRSDERRELREKGWALMLPHALTWWKELPTIPGLTWGWFERGFVEHVNGSCDAFLENWEKIFEVAPIQSLLFTGISREEIAALCDMKCMNRITKLELPSFNFGEEEAERILRSRCLTRLDTLIVRSNPSLNPLSVMKLKNRLKQLVL